MTELFSCVGKSLTLFTNLCEVVNFGCKEMPCLLFQDPVVWFDSQQSTALFFHYRLSSYLEPEDHHQQIHWPVSPGLPSVESWALADSVGWHWIPTRQSDWVWNRMSWLRCSACCDCWTAEGSGGGTEIQKDRTMWIQLQSQQMRPDLEWCGTGWHLLRIMR